MGTVIRSAEEKDIPFILDIINDEILHSSAIYDYSPRTQEEQREWFHNKQRNGFPLFVTTIADVVTGFGTYGPFREKAGYRKTVEHSIYIHHSHRDKGIGSALMETLIRTAREQGLHTLIAGIDSKNTGSISFHRKFGFIEVGRFKEVGYKFDRWLDVVFMQLMLNGKK